MTVVPLRVQPFVPDAAPDAAPAPDAGAFAKALDAVEGALEGANRAEDRFAYARGSLQDAAYERARADVALSVAAAAAQRIVQSVQSVLNMQV